MGRSRPAALPERRRRARDRACPRASCSTRLLEVERELGRVRDGPALGAAGDRPRPAALRRRDDRRAGPDGAASAAPRAAVRARAARRARPRPGRSGLRRGLGPCWRGYNRGREPPRRARRLRGRARAPPQAGVQRGLLALPLLRADAGRDVPLQQARPAVRPAAGVPVLPGEDGGRLGLGQEPADPDDPARRGLHVGRRDGRGAPGRGRGAGAHRRGARQAHERPRRTTTIA